MATASGGGRRKPLGPLGPSLKVSEIHTAQLRNGEIKYIKNKQRAAGEVFQRM